MALARRQWNNIIIFCCIFMVATLSFLQQKTTDIPSSAQPLFDQNIHLSQLQLDAVWFSQNNKKGQCDRRVSNCQAWKQAWNNVQVSPVTLSDIPTEDPLELILTIADSPAEQVWLLFPDKGLLKTSSGNWYLIPPSQRQHLLPKLVQ
ncbi:hypothetical protein D5R81_16045 [Parashewanella spongiae]|uniref:Uncharacterized protein n=1 Tax=Parashewanella spongiae TaxID=342950 RepID=A0A3A6TPT3_9GAMM|nr:hypothetical protein [Parashewanella spongiae]MCL1079599.1 hypothetical protein [Parashewanella spongiae]RJY07342.1 hypothetical protein D5R81_16045 [Parashewanella spongiae]